MIFVVAYQAEDTIKNVLLRIPASINEEYETEVLVIDDASEDTTFERGRQLSGSLPFALTVLFNAVNQGYGGNQKIGYHYAIIKGFDFVALLHGDGQYAPEYLPELLRPLRDARADACFGSRMMKKGGAIGGGMPLYKFVGNKILSWFENWMLRTSLTEFHSGYRAYSVAALKQIPFEFNTNDFHFDTEIIVQFVIAGLRIVERPIPTYYGTEICRVDGLKYAWNVIRAVTKARVQALGLFYDRRFDCAPVLQANDQYELKLDYESPHSLALETIPAGSRVLDLGCAGGYMAAALKQSKNCYAVGIDMHPLKAGVELDGFYAHDLNQELSDINVKDFDFILALDVIEHLHAPEMFVRRLYDALKLSPHVQVVVSTGNIAFIITRLMLLLGQFNYGKRGILDLTHTRLFTFVSLRRLFEDNGFRVMKTEGVPGPFPLAIRSAKIGRILVRLNKTMILLCRGLFSYQIFMLVRANPSVELLLLNAEKQSAERGASERLPSP